MGPYEDLLTTVKKRKLGGYYHVTRSTDIAKTILQGTVDGKRRRARHQTKWADDIDIEEWTAKPLSETQALAHDHER